MEKNEILGGTVCRKYEEYRKGRESNMNKMSDGLDALDKILEIRNFYIDNQKQNISDEIMWMYQNENNISELRKYLANYLQIDRIQQLSDSSIRELVEIRANYLYASMKNMGCKVNTIPLKVMVESLKISGN